MDGVSEAIRYIFVLSLILIVVAYFTGSTGVLNSLFSGVNKIALTATGRTQQGTFASYPTNG